MKIATIIKHAQCLAYMAEAGVEPMAFPSGTNTTIQHFEDAAGNPAVAVNQRGFTPAAADNEEEVNGLTIFCVVPDEGEDLRGYSQAIRARLDEVAESFLSGVSRRPTMAGNDNASAGGVSEERFFPTCPAGTKARIVKACGGKKIAPWLRAAILEKLEREGF